MSFDPDLLSLWTRGWALTRGAAAPEWDAGSWRIEVGRPDQLRRYLFGQAGPEVAARGAAIDQPHIFIKVCDTADRVRALLPEPWFVRQTGFVMRLDQVMPDRPLPEGYRLETRRDGAVLHVALFDAAGELAARGRCVPVERALVFDRIAVEPDHRRRGLGGAVMVALQAALADADAMAGLLVATDAGAALYQTLGWRIVSDYITADIPA